MPSTTPYAGRYRLEERLGAGAFGEVFAAFDEGLLQRRVAVKLLTGAPDGSPASQAAAERFVAEVRLAGALRHPHIAAVYDAGVWQGQLYMVQELVHGVDLGRFLAEHGPLSVDFVLGLARQMLDAVATAHERGVVHRDLKPGNLLVDVDHRLVVVDFGLAVSLDRPEDTRRGASGTPGYAAPEQLRGRGDARSDQFSLGVVLYQMLTGVAPFQGRSLPETSRMTLHHQPPPPSQVRPELPPGLDRVVLRALAKDPAERYPDLRQLAAELVEHAAFAQLTLPTERREALRAAVAARSLVVVVPSEPRFWARTLRLALVVRVGEELAPVEGLRVVSDPRQETFPAEDAPVCLDLDDEGLDRLAEADDGLRAALTVSAVLAVGLPPEHPRLRRLLSLLRGWGRPSAFAVAPRWGVEDLRAAARRDLLLIEVQPEVLATELAADLPRRPAPIQHTIPDRPFKCLSYFEEHDESIFFGRTTEIARLYARIQTRPVSLLYGASGAGKTSLIQAALKPRLQRAGHRVALARVFDDPMAEVCRAAGVPTEPPSERAARLAASARQGSLLVVFLDQAEELFVRFPRPVREGFADELRRALDASDGHLRLVLCMRADYLARLGELRELLPLSLERGLYLEPLSAAAMREAVAGPARMVGVTVEPALLDRIWADLGQDGVDPPQLQLVCDALWGAPDRGERSLTLSAYLALGAAGDILARHLSQALAGLSEAERAVARALLKAMVSTEDTRSVRRAPELARAAGISVERALGVLDGLVRLRLVRALEREDGAWYELTHDVLAREISRWLTDEDRRAAQVRELLEQGVRGHQQLGLLLSAEQLALVRPVSSRLALTQPERALIEASQAAARRGRLRVVAAVVVAICALLALTVAGRALWLSQHRFARATETRLSLFRWGLPQERRASPIVVARGAPDGWWLDGWLGYPRDAYETDWSLDDVVPEARDGLRAGVAVPADDPAGWLRERLTPTAATRERFLLGEVGDAGQRLRALADAPGLGAAGALEVAPMLAYGVADPAPALPTALELVAEHAAVLRVPGGTERVIGRLGAPLGTLLLRIPAATWGPRVDALQSQASGQEIVAELLSATAPPEELSRLRVGLDENLPRGPAAALAAAAAVGYCDALPTARAAASTDAGGAREVIVRAYARLVRGCGGAKDAAVLEGLLARFANGELSGDRGLELVRALHRVAPARAAAALAALANREGGDPLDQAAPWGFWADPRMAAALDPASPRGLHARVYQGDGAAVRGAWDYAFGDRAEPVRLRWLTPLIAFQGAWLRARSLEALADPELPVHLRLPLIAIVGRAGEAADATVIGAELASPDMVIVDAALDWLTAWPGALPEEVGAGGRQVALGRAVVALRRGEPSSVDFRAVLEDPGATYIEIMLALEGQRRTWSAAPAGAVAGLSSPVARVRLAASLALAGLPALPPLDPGDDPWLAAAMARARYAHAALAFDAQVRALARARLEAGQALYAQQLAQHMRSTVGTDAALTAALAPHLPSVLPAEVDAEWVYLEALAESELELETPIDWLMLYVPPSLWSRYAAEPLASRLRDQPLFNVIAGLQPPIAVEEP